MKRHLIIALTALAALLPAHARNVLDLKQCLSDSTIIYPESFETDTRRLLEGWYMQNYTATDDAYTKAAPNVSDEVIIARLKALPTIIEMPYNEVVRSYIDRYTKQGRAQVVAILGLNHYYEPIFEQVLEERGLPLELKYLPIIESSLDPNAVSRHGATGLWQFLLGTAKGLGLEVNSLVDERRDPYASSEKAADYLKDLFSAYGDWSLAIAAYNCGPGNISKALTRAGHTSENPKDFWDIYYYLPTETRGYVPGFIGATYAMNYYGKHGISPALAKRPILTDTVHINERVQFSAIADVLGIPMEEIRVLNPQYRKDIIPGDVRPYALRLPSQMVYNYLMNQDSIIEASRALAPRATVELGDKDNLITTADGTYREVVKWHKVKRGETLTQVANKYGVTTGQIKDWNGLRSNKLTRGKNLKIVTRELVASKTESAPATTTQPEACAPEAPADSVPFIQNGTPEPQIEANEEAEEEDPDEDEVEEVVEEAKPAPKPAPAYVTYRVRKGDTLYKIAREHDTTVDKIMQANNLTDNNLAVGQRLKIPQK